MPEHELLTIGWREWLCFPELGIPSIKAKVDTGARTSCLHAFELEKFTKDNSNWIRFGIHPLQRNSDYVVNCEAKIVDERIVTDSGGHKENRFVIATRIKLGDKEWPIEVTLTNRDTMRFRMLLGRTAMEKRIVVNPAASYLLGKPGHIEHSSKDKNVQDKKP